MIEAYFTLKFWLTITPILIVVLLFFLILIDAFIKGIKEDRNEKYLKKQGFEYYQITTGIWVYRKNGIDIYERDLYKYSLRKLKKIIKGEQK